MSNEVIWISLSSITSIVKEYYGVSSIAVNWLSMIYMLFYVFVGLAAYTLDRKGIKFTIMIGAVLNGLGSCLRLIGSNRNGFLFAFLGNASAALAQCFILFVPPSLAASWFGDNERATATAIGVLMNMLGVAVGFLMGAIMVPSSDDYDGVVRRGIFTTLLAQAIFCTLMVVLCAILVKDAPNSPPSMSQYQILKSKQKKLLSKKMNKEGKDKTKEEKTDQSNEDHINVMSFSQSLKQLACDKMFNLVTQAYGIYFGLFGAYNTVLNQLCMNHFPGKEKEIGLMGFTSVILGLVGIFLAGVWLDRTKRYKSVSVTTFLCCALTMLLFTFLLVYINNFKLVYTSFCLFGFFSYPYMTVGLEHAAELTYPISEGITSGILLLVGNMYAIILTYICGAIIEKGRSDVAGYVMTSLYVVGLITVAVMKGELKRLKIDQTKSREKENIDSKPVCCTKL